MGLFQMVRRLGSVVAFSHSVFALPFALSMVLMVSLSHSVSVAQLAAILVAVVSARTAAMAFNRYVDADIDARNVRTREREIPAGIVSKRSVLLLTVVSSALFIASAAFLGRHCLVLSPFVLVVLLGYSLMKRFSALCHLVLGFALALAPGGVWYALTAEWSRKPVPLMVAVITWVAGFDILYSCQDADFDRREGLFSIPSRLGVSRAMVCARLLHVVSVGGLFVTGFMFPLGIFYWLGVALFAALLASQHLLLATQGLSQVDKVFFTRNGAASVMLFLCVAMDVFLR